MWDFRWTDGFERGIKANECVDVLKWRKYSVVNGWPVVSFSGHNCSWHNTRSAGHWCTNHLVWFLHWGSIVSYGPEACVGNASDTHGWNKHWGEIMMTKQCVICLHIHTEPSIIYIDLFHMRIATAAIYCTIVGYIAVMKTKHFCINLFPKYLIHNLCFELRIKWNS